METIYKTPEQRALSKKIIDVDRCLRSNTSSARKYDSLITIWKERLFDCLDSDRNMILKQIHINTKYFKRCKQRYDQYSMKRNLLVTKLSSLFSSDQKKAYFRSLPKGANPKVKKLQFGEYYE